MTLSESEGPVFVDRMRPRAHKPWFAMAATTIGGAGLVIFAEGQLSGIGGIAASRLSVHASLLATLLLAVSAVLYLAHGLIRDRHVGRAASALAAAGASGVIGASLVRWVEVEFIAPGVLDYAGQYEALTWIAAIAVYIYLCIEDVYQTRLAGGFVLASVLAALGLAGWLIAVSPAPEQTFMALAVAYIGAGALAGVGVGIGALGAIGFLSVAGLARSRLVAVPGGAWRQWPSSGPPAYEQLLRWAMLAGLCGFTLAMMLWVAGQFLNREFEFDSRLPALWLDFAVLFLVWRLRKVPRDRLSWYALIAIALAGIGASGPHLIALVSGVPG